MERSLELAPSIIELRQYLLHRGRRDELIELFDREFVETQEVLGMRVVGQFRDLDRVNYFVWLRGFGDHASRREALTSFYSGPVWRKHGAAAGATMIDSDDVHQLRAISEPQHQLRIRRPGDRDADGDRGAIMIMVAHRRSGPMTALDDLIRETLVPHVEEVGVRTLGLYTTDPTANPFPALPVRASTRSCGLRQPRQRRSGRSRGMRGALTACTPRERFPTPERALADDP